MLFPDLSKKYWQCGHSGGVFCSNCVSIKIKVLVTAQNSTSIFGCVVIQLKKG